ncbi:MAG: DUF3592 domain-containing protein [Planctomycetes bacterium]|nr:DUF3592 domain-containing protein [Planctomycetota bacterium]MCL4731440.1 DUF3592 domain-containing protein [Planctomycetota bacterium]
MSNLDRYSRKPGGGTGGDNARAVPPGIALAVAGGHPLVLTGWLLLGFSMIFVWAFGGEADLDSLRSDGPVIRTTGRVTDVAPTSFQENKVKVYEVAFEYELAPGNYRTDKVFTTGAQYQSGQTVPVEYVAANPPRARISGTRRAPFGPEALLVLIFPVVALGLIIGGYSLGLRTLGVLRRGKPALGRLVDKQPTNTTINKQRVYALTFEYTDERGTVQRGTVNTHLTGKAEDEAQERLFYDPRDPSRVRLVDLLPSGVRLNERGELQGGAGAALLGAVLLPVLVLGVHGFVAWLMFG